MNVLAALVAPFKWLGNALFGQLPFCSLAGALAGMPAGFLFSLLLFELGAAALPLPAKGLVQAALVLTLVGWCLVLLVLCAWLRYLFASVAWPALLNALLTCLLTVYVLHSLALKPYWGTVVGLGIGVLVGWLFCLLCRLTGFGVGEVYRG